MIEFRRLNLMEPFRPAQPFQVIFCRNVMIYFNKETQGQLVNRFASCLEPPLCFLVEIDHDIATENHLKGLASGRKVSIRLKRRNSITRRTSRFCTRIPALRTAGAAQQIPAAATPSETP